MPRRTKHYNGELSDARIHFCTTEYRSKRIVEIARVNGLTRSEAVSEALQRYIEEYDEGCVEECDATVVAR